MEKLLGMRGVLTALITPMNDTAEGKGLDEQAYQDLVNWQIEQGIHGLVPTGTTGESATISHAEHRRLIELCVEAAAGRVPVVAGAGSNSTDEAIDLTRHAKQAGADAVLLVTPYYNKPTHEGLYQHFRAIHDAAEIPIILYNIPARAVINMSDGLIARLAQLPRIIGLKDATGDLARVSTLRQLVGDSFLQFSGEDMTALAFNAQGGHGCISVTSNIAPKLVSDMQNAWFSGNFAEAIRLQDQLVPLHDALFMETNPTPAKYALSLLRGYDPKPRLPLVLPAQATQDRLRKVLQDLDLL